MNSRPQSAEGACLATASALDLNLRALRPLLTRSEVTELCINQPGVAFLETREGWQRETIPFADFDWCRRLAKLVANSTRQRVDEESPLLSASLPSGERIQIVLPPATSPGCVAISIRRPSDQVWSIDELSGKGLFGLTQRASDAVDPVDADLMKLLEERAYARFLQ